MTLEDTDRLFQCPYCRIRLVLRSSPHWTYVLPAAEPYRFRPLVYVPYWRFRGLVFALDASDVTDRILDTSAPAVAASGLPPSLGLRPQAMALRFYDPNDPGTFLEPTVTLPSFLHSLGSGLRGRLKGAAAQIYSQAFIGESVSVIYTPFFEQEGRLCDAVTGRALGPWPDGLAREATVSKAHSRILFVPTLCPDCGGDLDGERDAVVLRCRTCGGFWETSGSSFHRVEATFCPAAGGEAVWIPFWELEAACHGFSLETFGDFVSLARIPTHLVPQKAARPFRFRIPAFKVAPRFFLRLARAATIGQTDTPASEALPDAPLYPVTLPSVEAFQACPILLGAASPAKEELFPKIRQGRMAFHGKRLGYLPLRRLSAEWVLDAFGFTLPLNALRWGRTL
ncbi:MAG: hypothetical protein WHS86_14145 [Desulfosoma sp.]